MRAPAHATLLAGFVVLDLTVTWLNYAALIGLSSRHAAETDAGRRAGYVAPAFTHALDVAVVLASVGTTVWFVLVARDLARLGRP